MDKQSHGRQEVGTLVQERVYQTIGSHELFLCTDGSYRALNGGYVINLVDMDIQVLIIGKETVATCFES